MTLGHWPISLYCCETLCNLTTLPAYVSTFDASDVTADVLVKPVGVDLLLVEVGQVLLEDVVRRPVRLAQVLHKLQQTHKERGD